MNFGVVKTTIIALVIAGVLAVICLDIALLANAGGRYTNSPAIPAVSMVAGILVGVIALLILFNSYYKTRKDGLIIMLGFFGDKIEYDDVIMLRQCIDTNELYIIAKEKQPSENEVALKINILTKYADKFIVGIREYIPNVTVELFSKPKEKKDKE